ncbi:nck-associated protein 5-like isoform X3 [Brienomyrus brachyistius]|nr:nck-associated protein 5-like isoform X3 [Brienomyrus brachyistius]XP_048834775.1 nck-associated protein 5-like isoform X3 [Brienomyrus brachyistius]
MTPSRYLEKPELLKRLSLDSCLAEYMDFHKCIEGLVKQLEEERRNVRRQKLAVARLQREVARSRSRATMREKLIHELEEERRQRRETEKRLREATQESELGRAQMEALQQHFSRMEETVRTLLQSQGVLDHRAVDTVDIIKAYKEKLSEETQKQKESLEEARPTEVPNMHGDTNAADESCEQTRLLLERLQVLEAENSALSLENENQRKQYERCLDEVANQVVQALLTQKDLREECLQLRTRVFDLEQQNRTLNTLFQQRLRPASDLLLQKLHSKILGLSSGDLLLDSDRNRGVPLSRHAESPPHEAQPSGRAGLPVRWRSQLSLTAPLAAAYPRSSCSSSEISLSSVCSEYSSGSYTWNDGKLSSLTWEKRMNLGSSAPGNICNSPEEQPPTQRKECHILAGLKRLQKRLPKEPGSLFSKPGYKDCMNSNEGIYSLGVKYGAQSMPKPSVTGRIGMLAVRSKTFAYDSDDADDESPRAPAHLSKDSWVFSKKLTHSVSDSLCSWDGGQDHELGDDKTPPGQKSKQPAEKLTTFTSGILSGKTIHDPSLSDNKPGSTEVSCCHHLSDTNEFDSMVESTDNHLAVSCPAERLERYPKRLSAELNKLPTDQVQRRPLSQIMLPNRTNDLQAEERVAVIFDAEDGEPIQLSVQPTVAMTCSDLPEDGLQNVPTTESPRLMSHASPDGLSGGPAKNYTVLESSDVPVQQAPSTAGTAATFQGQSTGSPSEHQQKFAAQQQKLIKPPYNQSNKVHPASAMQGASTPKTNLTKIPGRGKGSPQKFGKGANTEISNNGSNPGPAAKDRSPVSPPVKLSRFVKSTGGSQVQSAKGTQMSSKLPSRNDSGKGMFLPVPSSPPPPRKQLENDDIGELPTRDQHCDSAQTELRSPSPPTPPGRSTSLLIRPNYDNSHQALKLAAQPPAPSTVRGPPTGLQKHPQPPPSAPNIQHPGSHRGQGATDHDLSLMEVTPQKLVDNQSLAKTSTLCQTPTKVSPKWVPPKPSHSIASGYTPDHSEPVPKGLKNFPTSLLTSPKDSLQGLFNVKKSLPLENGHPLLYKASSSLPLSLEGHQPCLTEQGGLSAEAPKTPLSYSGSENKTQGSAEKASKTRLPIGLKALVKSPSLLSKSSTVPGKQEKEQVADSNGGASKPCGSPQSTVAGKPQVEMSDGGHGGSADRGMFARASADSSLAFPSEGRLFKRSVSVTTKPHLKPALGMNGAKARSQSFSTNYMEKPCMTIPEGAEKVRTHIITNTGERGNSLTRQGPSTLGVQLKASSGAVEGSHQHLNTRPDSHRAMSSSCTPPGVSGRKTSLSNPKEDVSKAEGNVSLPQKEVCGLSPTNKFGHKSSKQSGKVSSQPQFESASSSGHGPDSKAEGCSSKLLSPSKPHMVKSGKRPSPISTGQEEPEKCTSPLASTIEEKVMMGIVENVQKGQGQDKAQAPESKQKSSSSLANWFGFRRSKLPALGGKKAEVPKEKAEKKELKLGSVLGSRQAKSEKKKDKRKNETWCRDSQEYNAENDDEIGPVMDHHVPIGQLISQIQRPPAHTAADHFRMELLNGNVATSGSHGAGLPVIITQGAAVKNSEMKKDLEMAADGTKIMLKAGRDEDPASESPCQDHLPGSSCQMRTLDSGIGTFPLPESVARVPGRHLPKTEFCPRRASADPTEPTQDLPLPALPKSKVPSCPGTCLNHSVSSPSVSGSSMTDPVSWTPSTESPGAVLPKRLNQTVYNPGPEDHSKCTDARGTRLDHNVSTDKALRVCLYSGSSSEPEDDPEIDMDLRCRLPHSKTKNLTQADGDQEVRAQEKVGVHWSIMDYYRQELLVRYGDDRHAGVSPYGFLSKDDRPEMDTGHCAARTSQPSEVVDGDPRPGVIASRLESLNERNSSGKAFRHREHGAGGDGPRPGRMDGRSDKAVGGILGSLSDSLYDSFSSCASQSSADV